MEKPLSIKKYTRVCNLCYTEFTTTSYNKLYCSNKCYRKANEEIEEISKDRITKEEEIMVENWLSNNTVIDYTSEESLKFNGFNIKE